jgi:hypothetical protein
LSRCASSRPPARLMNRRGRLPSVSIPPPRYSRTRPARAITQMPVPGPVDARVELDVAGATVVAAVGLEDGAAVVGGVVVATGAGAAVVGVDEGEVSAPKRIVSVALSPVASPYVRVQVSPAACCAAVGGHG